MSPFYHVTSCYKWWFIKVCNVFGWVKIYRCGVCSFVGTLAYCEMPVEPAVVHLSDKTAGSGAAMPSSSFPPSTSSHS